MTQLGKMIILFGGVLVVIGVVVWGLGKAGFRGLPGDIRYQSERGNVQIYFPIVTCLVISAVGTLAIWLWQWLSRR